MIIHRLRTISHIRQLLTRIDFFQCWCHLAPNHCPEKYALTNMRYVAKSQPRPHRIRSNIITGTVKWTDINHWHENFLTFSLQYPKGIFTNITRIKTVAKSSYPSFHNDTNNKISRTNKLFSMLCLRNTFLQYTLCDDSYERSVLQNDWSNHYCIY